MLFTTLYFSIFFLAVYTLHWWVFRGRSRLWLLLAASALFYASWSFAFFLHFAAIVWITYALVRRMVLTKNRIYFQLLLIINFANLIFFKYFYLMLDALFRMTGLNAFKRGLFDSILSTHLHADEIILPLAISFYTFQLVAFAADARRETFEGLPSLRDFFLFIMFFPQLVAGPIMRHSEFFYQLESIRPGRERTYEGLTLFLYGLIKKSVLADNLAPAVDLVFHNPASYDALSNLLAPFGYAVRLYCDFSGYTDMARGSALLLGFDLPANFRSPFLASSMRDFWRRWHITLSSWLRDYIYIPLGGSRSGEMRSALNLIATFTIGGIWHGANYTFLIWGFFHGLVLASERFIGLALKHLNPAPTNRWMQSALRLPATLYPFAAFSISMIPFNAPDLAHAVEMASGIFAAGGAANPQNAKIATLMMAGLILNYTELRGKPALLKRRSGALLLGFTALFLLAKYPPDGQSFIYFQF
jgi:D-alanyl-lipoteichoic acid acyltransferase DltB (MBOAT superfamily)